MTVPNHPIPRLSPGTADDEGHAGDLPSARPPPLSSLFSSSLRLMFSSDRPNSPRSMAISFRPAPVRHRSSVARARASSSTSSSRSTPPGLPTCASRAPMDAFYGAAVLTVDRRHDRPGSYLSLLWMNFLNTI
ncbi:uncharacterized protein [Triticum aestivum]|uniref:uncharacterized protein n=1 Tax=Triticum aestivum TaxID=4565 RepID=UPI001D02ADA4|nr:uncharacterized protein LOC123058390 [Triticum aestivum]